MKKNLYNKYYKLGFEYTINKKVFGLRKPKVATNIVYFALIGLVIILAELF